VNGEFKRHASISPKAEASKEIQGLFGVLSEVWEHRNEARPDGSRESEACSFVGTDERVDVAWHGHAREDEMLRLQEQILGMNSVFLERLPLNETRQLWPTKDRRS
jgi:hypothetical protein